MRVAVGLAAGPSGSWPCMLSREATRTPEISPLRVLMKPPAYCGSLSTRFSAESTDVESDMANVVKTEMLLYSDSGNRDRCLERAYNYLMSVKDWAVDTTGLIITSVTCCGQEAQSVSDTSGGRSGTRSCWWIKSNVTMTHNRQITLKIRKVRQFLVECHENTLFSIQISPILHDIKWPVLIILSNFNIMSCEQITSPKL